MILSGQLVLAVLTAVLLGMASNTIVQRIRYRAEGVGLWLPRVVALIVLLNVVLLGWRVEQLGVNAAVSTPFDYTVLLATLLAAAAWFCQRNRAVLGLDGFLLPMATLLQVGAFAMVLREPRVPHGAAWLIVHQLSIIVGGAFFISGGLSGAVYLLLLRVLRRKRPSPLLGRLAPLESWERIGRWCTLLGFGFFTFGILTGICRVFHVPAAHRPHWLTDGLIWACFGLWGAYAAGLAATWLVPSFRGRRAALLATGSGAVLVAIFLVMDFLSAVHR